MSKIKILLVLVGLLLATNLRERDRIFNREVAAEVFGPLGPGYFWANQTQWLTLFPLYKFKFKTAHQPKYLTVNKMMAPSLAKVFKQLKHAGVLNEITQFRGCYNGRAIHGTNTASTHSYAMACDFDSKEFSEKFVAVWERNGWTWGGTWCNVSKDTMHFSYAWESRGKCSPYPDYRTGN